MVSEAPDTKGRAQLAGEARRLIMPEEMGESFKVMALTRGYDVPLAGFALQDLRRLL
jgi:SAM-dependent MidA family methyltransferase